MKIQIHNMHIPLSAELHARLRAEAKRSKQPATVLARTAIEARLIEHEKAQSHQALTEYAQEVAGSPADLDSNLEEVAVEHLLDTE